MVAAESLICCYRRDYSIATCRRGDNGGLPVAENLCGAGDASPALLTTQRTESHNAYASDLPFVRRYRRPLWNAPMSRRVLSGFQMRPID